MYQIIKEQIPVLKIHYKFTTIISSTNQLIFNIHTPLPLNN